MRYVVRWFNPASWLGKTGQAAVMGAGRYLRAVAAKEETKG